MPDNSEVEIPDWSYTRRLMAHVGLSPFGNLSRGRYGTYQGRPVIGRNSAILGGIDVIVSHYGEMIVVSEDEPDLPRVLAAVRNRVRSQRLTVTQNVLNVVYEIVREELPYDLSGTKRLTKKLSAGKTECKIPLAAFVRNHVGVCRHQALLAGYLIERLIADGTLLGTVSIDRNMRAFRWWEIIANALFLEFGTGGGHQWARFTATDGAVYIVDAAQSYCGPLSDAPQDPESWRTWFRPEDPRPKRKTPLFDELDPFIATAGAIWAIWYFLL